jgi:hypothetical protein
MNNLKNIIIDAKKLAETETGKDIRPLYDLANNIGQILAEKLGANKEIVMLGTLFMDLKRTQAVKENRLKDHTNMSLSATKEFLKKYNIDKVMLGKIYNCIEAHHGDVPFKHLEAEIVANADCYKFLSPKGFIIFISLLGQRDMKFNELLSYTEEKIEEKWKILSLYECKNELEEHYYYIKKLITDARENRY